MDTPETTAEQELSAPAQPVALVVDDRDAHRRRLVGVLQNDGWAVIEAENDKGAALALIDRSIDCAVFPATLAGAPSAGLVRSAAVIRESHPHPFGILVVMDTEVPESAERLIRAGADDVITPCSARSMSRRMRLVHDYRRLLHLNRHLAERVARAERKS
ncbi:MAG: hypothetical protein KC591_09715 [Gemmatimonadetes bacterium]|nr:hypothetical protein [Gemmatimonadota bacterium]